MANKIQIQQKQVLTITATTSALLDTAILAEINTLNNNTVGLTDSTGALTGTQTVVPGSISVTPPSAYLDTTPALHFIAQVQWTAFVQLT